MPVHADAEIRRLDQQEFERIACDVIEHVFAVHWSFDEHVVEVSTGVIFLRNYSARPDDEGGPDWRVTRRWANQAEWASMRKKMTGE